MKTKTWYRILLTLGLCALISGAILSPVFAAATPAPPLDNKALSEKVTTLEKENLVLREDLGKARLDARSNLEAAIAKLNQETEAKLQAERAAQAKKNRTFWLAIGAVAIGVLAAN
jgi:hypothetical protein